MMREFSMKKLGLAVMAGLGLTVAASSANAATITLKLVPTGGTTVTNAGDTVSFHVIASIGNTDGNNTNDGYLKSFFSVTSTEAAGAAGAAGNQSQLTYSSQEDTSRSQQGTVQNLDGNADLEVGSNDPSVGANYVAPFSGTSAKFGTGNTTNPTDLDLGTMTWTYNGGSNPGATSALAIALRVAPGLGTLAANRTVGFTQDGTNYTLKGDGTSSTPAGASVSTQGFTVTVTPEPTSLGLLGLGAMGLLARRRRNA
jgi:hypothetical protein